MFATARRLHARLDPSGEEREGGFTLIELLIVIVILGILGGIAIFAVDGFKGRADTACANANTRINATVSAANATGSGTTASASGSCPA